MNILPVNLLFSTFVFWIAARIYIFPKLPGAEAQDRSIADSFAPCISTPRADVFSSRSDLCWNPSAIRLSGSIRRPACCFASSGGHSGSGESCPEWPAACLDFQRGRNRRLDRSFSFSYKLWGAAVHGPSLLDSCVLGSCFIGDYLHHLF